MQTITTSITEAIASTAMPTTKRRRGRPKSETELSQITIYLRPDQVETLKRFAAKRHYIPELDNVSAVIRSLVDATFPEGYGK
jgi:hypothetical protein